MAAKVILIVFNNLSLIYILASYFSKQKIALFEDSLL